MPGDKLRFRFTKTGTLRLLSHHDLMRCLERMLRRAELPFKSTAGFHPGPRVVFALSLPLGVEALDEVVEIEFTRAVDENETLAALHAEAPVGLEFTRVSLVRMKATALPRRMVYRLELPPDRFETTSARCDELLGMEKVYVERLKPSPKRLNIRPYFRGMRVAEGHLLFDLWVTQTGTARADELMKLLDVADLVDSGSLITRTLVELRDEVTTTDPADAPPDGPADTLPLEPASLEALMKRDHEQSTLAGRDVIPAGPVVE